MHRVLSIVLLIAASAPLAAQDKPKASAKIDRANKMWDDQLARMLRAHLTAECRDQAAKAYSAIRFNKRREFVDECVAKGVAAAQTPASASHQAQ